MSIHRKLGSLPFFSAILMLVCSSVNLLYAQNFERFSNKEGFNQNTITTIEQDRYGFLWYGTRNGLIRYDGYEFETYTVRTKSNGNISSNEITFLFNDTNGVLWIGTNLGLNAYVPSLEKFLTVPINDRLSISHIGSGPNGQIWFAGENKLYVCELVDIDEGIFNISDNLLESQPDFGLLNDFSFNDDDSILLASSNGVWNLSLTDVPNSFPKFKSLNGLNVLANKYVTSLLYDQNSFWVGTRSGLHQLSLGADDTYSITDFDSSGRKGSTDSNFVVNTIFKDNSENVWIGTNDNGIFKYEKGENRFQHFEYDPRNQTGLSSQNINALFQDDFNVLWIGTAQGGINKLDLTQKPFIGYSNNPYDDNSLTDNLLTAILEDSRGILWLSGYNDHLFRSTTLVNDENVNSLEFENLENRFPIAKTDIVRIIYEDKRGYIWFGTDQTLVVYHPVTNQFKNISLVAEGVQVFNKEIRNIYQEGEDTMILLGSHLTVLKNPWDKIGGISNPTVEVQYSTSLGYELGQALLRANDGSFWIGTTKGLFHGRFDGKQIKINGKYSDERSDNLRLSYGNVFALHQDGEGNIWVGTFGGGLNKITLDSSGEPTKIDFFRKNEVLPHDAIYGILQVDKDYLWISTDMGLVRLRLQDNNVEVFDVRDGLAQNNFRQGSYFKGDSGFFYFGGLNGLTIFRPEDIKLNTQPPKVVITDLFINNERVRIGEKLNNKVILEKSISETESIAVSQKEQFIAFNLAVEHTSTPSKNRVAYKLEGFNEDWIVVDAGKTTVTYTNLPADKYVLKVKAANGDGTWSTETNFLNVTMLPPWYRTWWSYLLFTFSIFGIGAGIVVYFSQNEKLKQRLKYEKLDKERIETINQGKFRYFTNMSHEFRTPLTLISGPLEGIIANNTDQRNNKYLAIIQKNTKRLLSLVDQLITFRQAEQGYLNLNLTKDTLGGFIFPITEAFENYAKEKDINFFYKVSSPDEEIVIDVEKTERIIFNLLSNSFKNTPALGNISIESKITYESEKKMIHIDVVDTGKGIPKEDIENIFERFYQLGHNTDKVSGGGIGLSFCKSLVTLLGGRISVKSNPEVETRFSVVFPSKPAAEYNTDEINFSEKSFVKNWIPISAEITEADTTAAFNGIEKKYSILLVENEVDVQTFLKGILSEKYKIELANNGVEGLEKIGENEPDLIISDVMMPEMDGFELCERIKSDADLCHIPILLLTALGDMENTVKGLEFGADEYLSKPFSIKHLELRVDKLIENRLRLQEYFSKNSTLPTKNIGISKKDEQFLNKMIDAIEKNLSDSTFGVEELALEIGLSTSHFYRRLKQLTGQVPNAYLRNFRLQRAAELLQSNEGLNVAEVMYRIGIESSSYFSASFKKLHGVPPSEYLKEQKI